MLQSEREKLMHLEDELHKRVVGQEEAIEAISDSIRRNRAGLGDAKRPIGSFIFLGTTGVGKTELAKALAEFLFNQENALVRIDMSEYQEKHTVSRLIGAPPGYVGYEEGGQLTEKVRRKPYSVVLLDEIEKAHPDIFNILLQVLDDGQLTDGLGRKVDFKNTLIIMTSNIGARQLKDFGAGVGFTTATKATNLEENNRGVIEKALKRTFSPEFLNRIDDVIIFNSLEEKHIAMIIDIIMKDVMKRLNTLGFNLILTDEAKKFIAEKGYDQQFGARPLHRAIQKYLEDPLAEEILNHRIKAGDDVTADYNEADAKIVFKIDQSSAKKEEEKAK
jgi:ATP-dependent Clp protease ATP-binding subunit ClpC